jgi:hypothetical protein
LGVSAASVPWPSLPLSVGWLWLATPTTSPTRSTGHAHKYGKMYGRTSCGRRGSPNHNHARYPETADKWVHLYVGISRIDHAGHILIRE